MRLDHIDIDDELVAEVERRMPNATWQTIITDAITYALAMADTGQQQQQPDNQPPNNETASAEQQT